jgi:predicted ATPase
MAYPEARIFSLDGDGIRDVRYEDTEHYAITKAFLQDPGRMLRELFREVDDEGDS